MQNCGKLAGYTVLVTGASRGIGKAVALKVARDGANVAVAAKTSDPHPKLPGTIHTAAKEINEAGGQALACVMDVRRDEDVQATVDETVERFGGIDILVNNASAIFLTNTLNTTMKNYDLLHQIILRGTFLCSKLALPYLIKSKQNGKNPHILNMSPPLNMKPKRFSQTCAYTTAKTAMSMYTIGMAEEFSEYGVAVNSLWPKTAIITTAVEMLSGWNKEVSLVCRKPDIIADASYAILMRDSTKCTGNIFIDEDVVKKEGISDMDQYAVDPSKPLYDLANPGPAWDYIGGAFKSNK